MTAAEVREAVRALDFYLGWAGGWLPVYSWKDGRAGAFWHRCGESWSGRALEEMVRESDRQWSQQVELGIPQRKRWNGVTASTVLWARVEGGEQVKRARAFKPHPTMVLQEGSSSRRLLLWALEERLDYFRTVELNKRIAYRLRGVQKHADPDALRIPAPGTFLRAGRSRPVPVVVGRLTSATFTGERVAGRLPDPPEVKWEGGQVVVERGRRRVPA